MYMGVQPSISRWKQWWQALVVEQAYRGGGVGKAMMEAAETWAAEQGFKSVVLGSHVSRLDAHAFYRARGYQCAATSHLVAKHPI